MRNSFVFALACLLAPASSLAFDTGSDGSLGDFMPTEDVTVPLPEDGVLHYGNVVIPAGVTVKFAGNTDNTPVWLLSTGDVIINGTVDVRAKIGTSNSDYETMRYIGGTAGPGGFAGGWSSTIGGQRGFGPGGGPNSSSYYGGDGGSPTSAGYAEKSWHILAGGSGGGGSNVGRASWGGAGVITIAAAGTLSIGGTVEASAAGNSDTWSGDGGAGFVRLVADTINGSGTVRAAGAHGGGTGYIRFEALLFQGSLQVNSAPNPELAPPQIAVPFPLAQRPRLEVVSIGGQVPVGELGALPPNMVLLQSEEYEVIVRGEYIPLGTVAKLVHASVGQGRVIVDTTPFEGTLEESTATALITVPAGTRLGHVWAYVPSIPVP